MRKRTYPPKKAGSLRAAETFLAERAGRAKPKDLLRYLRKAPKVAPAPGDEPPARGRATR